MVWASRQLCHSPGPWEVTGSPLSVITVHAAVGGYGLKRADACKHSDQLVPIVTLTQPHRYDC